MKTFEINAFLPFSGVVYWPVRQRAWLAVRRSPVQVRYSPLNRSKTNRQFFIGGFAVTVCFWLNREAAGLDPSRFLLPFALSVVNAHIATQFVVFVELCYHAHDNKHHHLDSSIKVACSLSVNLFSIGEFLLAVCFVLRYHNKVVKYDWSDNNEQTSCT